MLRTRSQTPLRPSTWAVLLGATTLVGCSTLNKPKIIPDSIAKCRSLAQRGASAMEMGDSREAQRLLTDAVESEPTDTEARRQLAEALWENGKRGAALLQLERALELDPRHAPTVVRAGEMLLAMGQTGRAEEFAEDAVALAPWMAEAWALRGKVFREVGEPKRALADLQQALAYAPQNTKVLESVAQLQLELDRPHGCLTTVHCLMDQYPPGEEPRDALWLQGLAYGALDRHHEAASSLAEASQRGEPPAQLLHHLASAAQECGDAAAAAQATERALAASGEPAPNPPRLASPLGTPAGTLLR